MIEWKKNGNFIAHIASEDTALLVGEIGKRLQCVKCGKKSKFWICDVRVVDGETLISGEIHGLIFCEEHGKPLIHALNKIRKGKK